MKIATNTAVPPRQTDMVDVATRPSNSSEQKNHGEKALRPPLKWAGGKRWLVPQLSRLWEQFEDRNYLEPFCGGLAVPLALRPRRARLNDINPHLINFYRQVQMGLSISNEMHYEKEMFYSYRARFNQLIKDLKHETSEAAELFYYLNRTCYNGLCRFNQSGEFNVPFGSYKSVSYLNNFDLLSEAFQHWSFSNFDLEDLDVGKHDFIYADPPYDVEFRSYSAGGFSWEDQVRTAEWLARHRGPVALSNQATPRIVELYHGLGFELTFLSGPRRISCTGDRTAAREVLATKNIAGNG